MSSSSVSRVSPSSSSPSSSPSTPNPIPSTPLSPHEASLRAGRALRERHNWIAALRCYDEILASPSLSLSPDTATEALNCRGVCLKELGHGLHALACYDAVLQIDPHNWAAYNNKGVVYKDAGFIDDAIRCYAYALSYSPPNDSLVKHNLAVALVEKGVQMRSSSITPSSINNNERAIACFSDAISYNPRYPQAYFNLGFVHADCGKTQQAMQFYHQALELAPDYAEAMCNLGVLYKNEGHLNQAIALYQQCLSIVPNFEVARNNLAIAYTDLGTQNKNSNLIANSIHFYKKALTYNPSYSHAWYNLGVAYSEANQIDDSVISYEMAIRLNPDFAEAYNNLGVIAKESGNYERSIQLYEAALRINPHFAQTLNNLGVIYTMIGKMTEGLNYCSLAVKVNPQYSEAYNNLGVLFRDEGRIEEAVEMYEKCLALDMNSKNAGQNRLLALNYSSKFPISYVSQQHAEWGKSFSSRYKQIQLTQTSQEERRQRRRIRLGFVSPDFCTHSVSYFIEAPLRLIDRAAFKVFLYSNVSRPDSRTDMFRDTLNHTWRDIHHLNTDQACEVILNDEIDILVDLTGHTAGNRLDIFAMKPAPIQVTWIGYPNSTGLRTVDFRITDELADPLDSKQAYVETLIRPASPECAFLCYTPPLSLPEVSSPPCLANGFITFGSFNNLAKITPEVIGLWSEVLLSVPSSRMLMKCKPFATKQVQDRILDLFASFGIESHRLDLIPLMSKTEDHLSCYSSVDIALDSFPYAGTTTTCEALVMGVPVITLATFADSVHAQNVGKSLISRVGILKFCIATSRSEYVEIAAGLAHNTRLLERLRLKTRSELLGSSLCDGVTFTKHIEKLFSSLLPRSE